MTLEQLGNLGEFIASIATLMTLVHLALQIRQNTAQLKLRTSHEVLATGQEVHPDLLPGHEPHLARRIDKTG